MEDKNKEIMENKHKEIFENLYQLNTTDKVEERGGFNYLSWAWAWAELKKHYPTAKYSVREFRYEKEGGVAWKPYLIDDCGALVMTEMTIDGLTHEMWLPVMDGANQAMKKEAYEYSTKSGPKQVKAFTMFDINKAIMRCLVKNIAMFGLGLHIYAGEDLPEVIDKPITKEQIKEFNDLKIDIDAVCKHYKITKLELLSEPIARAILDKKRPDTIKEETL